MSDDLTLQNLTITGQTAADDRFVGSVLIELSTTAEGYDGLGSWSIPLPFCTNKYSFKLHRVDYFQTLASVQDFTVVCNELKMQFSNKQDFFFHVNANRLFTPITTPIEFVGSVNGRLNYRVNTSTLPSNFGSMFLYYNVFLNVY